jgi:hypothetical protein
MKIDDTTKIVSTISVIVGLMITLTGYLANKKLQQVQTELTSLNQKEKAMDVQKKEYDMSARISADFDLPLARSFAARLVQSESTETASTLRPLFPDENLGRELHELARQWNGGNRLMTGEACTSGLTVRQIVLLTLRNVGSADATDVVLVAAVKNGSPESSSRAWRETVSGKTLAYYELPGASPGWREERFKLEPLGGASSLEAARKPQQLVMASVSGPSSFYGTAIIPKEITWTDAITGEKHAEPVLGANVMRLKSDLVGAEIGKPTSACRQQ